MKLLFCIDHFGPGGAQRQLVNLAKGLSRCGHEVEFFIYHPQYRHFTAEVEEAGITVHAYAKRQKWSPAPVVQLGRLIRRGGFDGVLTFLQTPAVYAELASLARRNVPLIVSERFMYTEMDMFTRARQELHRLATWITVNSHHQRERMEFRFPWMQSRISTIYNGVDLEVFRPRESIPEAAPQGGMRFVAVANTARKKNALGLARALAHLKKSGRPVPKIDWVGGSADDAEAAAKSEVDAFLQAEGLDGTWTWMGKRSDVAELLRNYDALVHPAHFEGLPNAICEALASGLPVLASAVCDHPRLVGSDRGLLFDPDRAENIADSIEAFGKLTADDRRAMARRARAFAEEQLSLQRYVKDYEDLFSRLAGRRGEAPAVGIAERTAP